MAFASTSGYITVAEAMMYFEANGYEYTSDVEKRMQYVVRAANYLDDNYIFKGTKTVETQERDFPRTGITGIDPNTVPDEIKEANALVAQFISQNPNLEIHGASTSTSSSTINQEVKSQQVGDIRIEYSTTGTTRTSETTRDTSSPEVTVVYLPSIDKILLDLLEVVPNQTVIPADGPVGSTAVIRIG